MKYSCETVTALLIGDLHGKPESKDFFARHRDDPELLDLLIRLFRTHDSEEVRMCAAIRISKVDVEILAAREAELLELAQDELDPVASFLDLALIIIRFAAGVDQIMQTRIKPAFFREAELLKEYPDNKESQEKANVGID